MDVTLVSQRTLDFGRQAEIGKGHARFDSGGFVVHR
jgi:hypothetical protein